MASLEELAYTEAVRACTQQQAALEAVRTRAIAIVGAAAVTTGLLGQPALKEGDLDCWATAALGCLVAIGFLAAYVLLPREWGFSNNVGGLVGASKDVEADRRDDELADYLRHWAWFLQETWDKQNKTIGRMTAAYGVATVLLVALVLTWAGRLVQ